VPLTFTAGAFGSYVTSFSNLAISTANLVGKLPANMSHVVKGSNVVTYFQGLSSAAAPNPFDAGSPLNGRFTNLQVVNSSGQAVLTDPLPGTIGNTAQFLPGVRGPSLMGINFSASKNFRIGERYTFSLRADAVNATNTPQWGYSSNPSVGTLGLNTNINSTLFGRITSAAGNRFVTFYARLDF
jgi:hypothetical protein